MLWQRTLIKYLKNNKPYLFKDDKKFKTLRLEVRKAMFACANDTLKGPVTIPVIEKEPSEIFDVLNFILVDWNKSIYKMILMLGGRKLLRTYAVKAKGALDRAIKYLGDYDHF